MVHLTCHFMRKISYTYKHTCIFKISYLMMHDLVLITINQLFKNLSRHSLPPLKRISSRDSDEMVPQNWYIITKYINYKNLEVQCGVGIGVRRSMQQGCIHINQRYQRSANDTIVQPPLFSTSRGVLVVMVPDDHPSTSPHAPKQNRQIHEVLGRIVASQFIAHGPIAKENNYKIKDIASRYKGENRRSEMLIDS